MPQGKASMKAMKAKGSQGALQKGSPMKKKEHLKRPAALPQPGQGGMSLEEKMELFQKSKNQNIQSWLDSLTKGQREAMWQRFANARASLKDPENDNQWSQVAKGKGSDHFPEAWRRLEGQEGPMAEGTGVLQVFWPLGCKSVWEPASLEKGLVTHECIHLLLPKVKSIQRNGFPLPQFCKGLAFSNV